MIQIRACAGFDEMQACVELQIETWGYDENDVIPRKAFLVAEKIGGQVIGAFDGELADSPNSAPAKTLVGFAMSLPGIKRIENKPRPYLHSHMLAVRPSHRNRGLGAQLKREQRREALSRGIRHIEWTFDPLEIKNAYLNIHRLGAISRAYLVDFYGVSSSRLQGGLPTDRLLAEWELDSPRVKANFEGLTINKQVIQERIVVPASIEQWKANERYRENALAIQIENRQRFLEAFAKGLAILGFSRDAEGNGVFELGSPTQTELEADSEEQKK